MPFALSFYNAYHGINNYYTEGRIMSREKRIDIKDITGQKFADLTAISWVGKGKYRGAVWLCKCECGNTCSVPGGHLRAGKRKSCGCRSQSRIFETGINRVFSSYKRLAIRRNLEFNLSREELEKIVTGNCNYCGTEPGNELKRQKSKKTQIKYSGIDRFDPTQGYISGNCVPCCYYCNHAKHDFSILQWKEHLKRIINHMEISNGI